MYNNYEDKEYIMLKKNLKGITSIAKSLVKRAKNYDFNALCEDIQSVYVSNDSFLNTLYEVKNGLIKGKLDTEYMEDYIPYSSKKFTNVFPAYTYIKQHKGSKPKKDLRYGDEITDWASLNVDISKYLALQGNVLFEIVHKLVNPKITANNYNITKEEVSKISSVLLKALEYQKQFMQEQYNNKLISQNGFDKYMAENRKHKIVTKLLPDIWNGTRIGLAKREYRSKRNYLKKAKLKLIKFFAKNEKMRVKKQPENDYSAKESHSIL